MQRRRLEECVLFFLYWGVVVMIHSWNLNWEEVRRRQTGFTSSLGCCCCFFFSQRKANRETCWLKLTGLSWAAIYLSPGFCSLECAFCFFFSHCLHFLTIWLFSSVPQDHFCFSFFSFFLQFFSNKSQFNTASSLLSHTWQAWMYENN